MFPDNNSREITPEDLRKGLKDFLDTISARIGSLPNLTTAVKKSIVGAINELNYRLELLSDRFSPQFGQSDPNVVPPPNSYDYGSTYIQEEVIEGDVRYISFWIYTGVDGVGWLSLTDSARIKELMFFENGDTHNYPPSKKGDIKFIKIWNESAGVEIPDGYAFLGGSTGKIVGNDTVLITREDNNGGTQTQVGESVIVINQKKQIIEVEQLPATGLAKNYYLTPDDKLWRYYAFGTFEKPSGWYAIGGKAYLEVVNLPTTGISGVIYSRTSDNTLWRWQLGGSIQYPISTWVQINAIHVHKFTYDGTNATQSLSNPLNQVIDLQIEQGCNFDDYIEPFTPGDKEFTVKNNFLSVGNKLKLIYK